MRRKGARVIFDLNDAIFLPTGSLCKIKFRTSFCLEKIIQKSDFVTVNGHYLLRYVKSLNDNATFIHDPIDTTLFTPNFKKRGNKITIGWEGTPSNHYQNLALIKEPLTKLAKKFDIRFKIVSYLGDLKVKNMFNELEGLTEIDYGSKHWVPMNKFPELLSDFDIMVAPLHKTAWYEGKSALRAGLGMAMGIPVVASPVGEQKHLIKHGINGFLAKNKEEWYQQLKFLIERSDSRREIGRKGRETAEKELSLQVCGEKLYNILKALTE
ncbi:MAG: glycosyltransferase [Candidatus Bathyarchaeota archaeon]|nr:MAG: glycosyltransferase [Candidatus Bathyarchaeota archaeon]